MLTQDGFIQLSITHSSLPAAPPPKTEGRQDSWPRALRGASTPALLGRGLPSQVTWAYTGQGTPLLGSLHGSQDLCFNLTWKDVVSLHQHPWKIKLAKTRHGSEGLPCHPSPLTFMPTVTGC